MSFASLCIFTYMYPVPLSPQRTAKKFLRFEHPTAKKFLRFYHATTKKFPGLELKRPAMSRKKSFFLRTQKEVLACALFLGCTVFIISSLQSFIHSKLSNKLAPKGHKLTNMSTLNRVPGYLKCESKKKKTARKKIINLNKY